MGRLVYGLDSRLSRPGRHIGLSHSKRSKRAQAGRSRSSRGRGRGQEQERDRAGLG